MNNYIFNNIIIFIKKYEKINIKIIKKDEPCIMMFFETIHIFNDLTNVILMNKIEVKKMY